MARRQTEIIWIVPLTLLVTVSPEALDKSNERRWIPYRARVSAAYLKREVAQITDMTTLQPYIERDPFVVRIYRSSASPKSAGHIHLPWCVTAGTAKLFLSQDEEAVGWLRRSIDANRMFPLAHFFLAAALAHQGKTAEAQAAARAGIALAPAFTVRRFRDEPLSDNPIYLAQRERVYEGMRKAGMPDE